MAENIVNYGALFHLFGSKSELVWC